MEEKHDYINSIHCKVCKSIYDKNFYKENRIRRRFQTNKYYLENRDNILERQTKYFKTEHGKIQSKKNTINMYKKYKIKAKARAVLNYHVKNGSVIKEDCSIGSNCYGRIEAHHEDYSKPLDVIWLCVKHHRVKEGTWVML